MFNRAELKDNAKKILSKNYWWIVLVTLILGLVTGSGTGVNFNFDGNNTNNSSYYSNEFYGGNSTIDEFGNVITEPSDNSIVNFDGYFLEIFNAIKGIFNGSTEIFASAIMMAFLVIFAISLALGIFVLNPLQIGCRRWFLKNRKEKPEMSEIVYVFSHGYTNAVKVMFFKDLYVFLWSLLFIIPGIVKGYEYRMIPFLLAENPEMDMQEAFERSRKLMDGNKMDTFVLDLSFFGWALLSAFTCGILTVFYVSPYMALTDAELYVCLCQGRGKYVAESNGGNSYEGPSDNQNNTYGSSNDSSYGNDNNPYSGY